LQKICGGDNLSMGIGENWNEKEVADACSKLFLKTDNYGNVCRNWMIYGGLCKCAWKQRLPFRTSCIRNGKLRILVNCNLREFRR
jgi:hypothetical protein